MKFAVSFNNEATALSVRIRTDITGAIERIKGFTRLNRPESEAMFISRRRSYGVIELVAAY